MSGGIGAQCQDPTSCLTVAPKLCWEHLSYLHVVLYLVSVPLNPPCPIKLPEGRNATMPSISYFFSVL